MTRYEMELYKQISERDNEIVMLKAEKSANARADGLQAQISQNAAWAAGVTANLGFMAQQIGQLYSLTQLVVPNGSVAPGWGPAMVRPIPPFPPVTPPANEVASTPTTTTTGG